MNLAPHTDPAFESACDARDVLLELAAHPKLRDGYTLHAISDRLGKGYSTVQRWFDPSSGRHISDADVARIGPEFASRFYRRRLARYAARVEPATDPRHLALALMVDVGHAAEKAERVMADRLCSAVEWREVAAQCGVIASNASRAEAAALLAAAVAGGSR